MVRSSLNKELKVSAKLDGKSLAAAWFTVKSLPRLGWDTWMLEGEYCWRL